MKINSSVFAVYLFFFLIPVSYCIYLEIEIKNTINEYKSFNSKELFPEDRVLYEESTNYKYGFEDGYESAKNEEKITNWQASILTKGYESGMIKCYYVASDGKHIEFPLKKWIHTDFPLNKWMPSKQ